MDHDKGPKWGTPKDIMNLMTALVLTWVLVMLANLVVRTASDVHELAPMEKLCEDKMHTTQPERKTK